MENSSIFNECSCFFNILNAITTISKSVIHTIETLNQILSRKIIEHRICGGIYWEKKRMEDIENCKFEKSTAENWKLKNSA